MDVKQQSGRRKRHVTVVYATGQCASISLTASGQHNGMPQVSVSLHVQYAACQYTTTWSACDCMVSIPFVKIPLHSQYATCQYTTDKYDTVGQYATNPPARYTTGKHATGQCKAFSLGIRRRILSRIPSVVTTSIWSFSNVTHLSHSSISPTVTVPASSPIQRAQLV